MNMSLTSCPPNMATTEEQQSQPQDSVTVGMMTQAKDVNNSLRRRNVYVSGLPESFRAADFREMCQAFGRVEASKLCMDSKSRPARSYGFALFFKEIDAAECIKNLNGRWVGGQALQARLADAAATPVPLDPVSAHPPITRARPYAKAHRTPSSSLHSTTGAFDGSLMLTKSIPLSLSPVSSQDVTPPVTPPQLALTPTLLPQGNSNINNNNINTTGATSMQPVFYHTSPLDQQVGCTMATFPSQQGYMSVPSQFVQAPMMGMPVYLTMPQSTSIAGGVPQQFVVPNAMMTPGGYPQQMFSQVLFSP